jgi:hypothetical protein
MATDLLTTANESTVKVITFAQDQFLKAYKTIASKVPATPMPSWLTPDPEQGRKAVERAFDLQSQLLEQNKAFALGLIEAAKRSGDDTTTSTTTTKK